MKLCRGKFLLFEERHWSVSFKFCWGKNSSFDNKSILYIFLVSHLVWPWKKLPNNGFKQNSNSFLFFFSFLQNARLATPRCQLPCTFSLDPSLTLLWNIWWWTFLNLSHNPTWQLLLRQDFFTETLKEQNNWKEKGMPLTEHFLVVTQISRLDFLGHTFDLQQRLVSFKEFWEMPLWFYKEF